MALACSVSTIRKVGDLLSGCLIFCSHQFMFTPLSVHGKDWYSSNSNDDATSLESDIISIFFFKKFDFRVNFLIFKSYHTIDNTILKLSTTLYWKSWQFICAFIFVMSAIFRVSWLNALLFGYQAADASIVRLDILVTLLSDVLMTANQYQRRVTETEQTTKIEVAVYVKPLLLDNIVTNVKVKVIPIWRISYQTIKSHLVLLA